MSSWLKLIHDRRVQVALLAFLVAVSYLNTLSNPFLWDDIALIVENDGLKQGWTSVLNAFSPEKWGGRSDNPGFKSFFRPMQSLLSIFDYWIWGLNAFGFHLSNMLLHLANTVLLLFFALRLTGSSTAALAAASIFAVHPIHTESVAFIAAMNDLLAALFMTGSFIFYMRSGSSSGGSAKSPFYSASLFLFVLALLSKEMAVMMPLLVSVYAWLYEDRGGRALRAIPFYAVLAGYIAFRVFGLEVFVEQHQLRVDILTLGSSSAAAVFDYLRLMVAPYPLKAFYTLRWHSPFSFEAIAGFVISAAALLAFILFAVRGKKALAFALAWLFVSMAPVLNIGALGDFRIAERYMYIPTIGFSIFAGIVFAGLPKGALSKAASVLLVAVIAVFIVLTFQRNRLWGDDLRFFTAMVKESPDAPLAHLNLAVVYQKRGERALALSEMERCRDLAPGNWSIRYSLGFYYYKAGLFAKAADELEISAALNPKYENSQILLGVSYAETGRLDDAEALFIRVLKANPASKYAADNLLRLEEMRGAKPAS
ncbi:MAG: hypothetical protein A2054_03015 [Deltaproteobacteria bacterium GWA2_55_10]|nr:MAG: hypothetical protein A2054_03015 [Deltaproteobacteria bacterium GWA2_55_10]